MKIYYKTISILLSLMAVLAFTVAVINFSALLDIFIAAFFIFWAIIVLAAAFQRPADMNEGFEDNFPEKKIFDENKNK